MGDATTPPRSLARGRLAGRQRTGRHDHSSGASSDERASGSGAAQYPPGPWLPNRRSPGSTRSRRSSRKAAVRRLKRSAARTCARSGIAQAWEFDRKHAGGNPATAARKLAADEQKACSGDRAHGRSSRRQRPRRLLDPRRVQRGAAADDFSGVMVPATVFGDRTCAAGNVQSGPLHNTIPNPAEAPFPDNNTFWVPDFSPEHFDKLLYTSEEHHRAGPARPHRSRWPTGCRHLRLHDAQPLPGDVQGRLLGRRRGDAVGRGASEAWYGADRCTQDSEGNWVAGPRSAWSATPTTPPGLASWRSAR